MPTGGVQGKEKAVKDGFLDIVDVLGRDVELVPTGRLFKGDCPFCKGHNTLLVSRDHDSWHCFGDCADGGSEDLFRHLLFKQKSKGRFDVLTTTDFPIPGKIAALVYWEHRLGLGYGYSFGYREDALRP